MNPANWLARTARAKPAAPALLSGTIVVANYAEFARRAASIGAALVARGVAPGDRVAIFLPNSVDYLPIFYGILWAAATTVPINGKLHVKEAAWIVTHSAAKFAFSSDAELSSSCDAICIHPDSADFAAMQQMTGLGAPAPMAMNGPAWLFYASGTTGRPKGAVLSCGNLIATSLCYLADVDDVAEADATLYAAPMSHGAGLYNFVHIQRDARNVIPESGGFTPAEILSLAGELGNFSMFAAPTMVRRLVDHAK